MKKLLSFILLFLILLKIGGLVAVLSVEREMIREKMFENIGKKLNNSNLSCFVANSTLEWEEAEQELWYNGKLYDVVKIEVRNGQTHYFCLADDAETDIVTTIKNLLTYNQKPLGKALSGFVSWVLDSVFLFNQTELHCQPVWSIFEQSQNSSGHSYQFSYYFKTIKPPMMSCL